MRYLPHTDAEVREMLEQIGVSSIDDLFEPVPEPLRAKKLDLEPALDEAALMAHLERLADRNEAAKDLSFLGAGMYDHHIPPAVDQLLLRSEFYTAYTPYQGEVSQGTLQAIYEFQTMVCELFDMEVANASMYDAASATAEAVLMARRVSKGKKSKVILSGALHPHAIDTVRTYLKGLDEEGADMVVTGVTPDGRTDLESVKDALGDSPAALVVGYPNFFGCVEDLEAMATAIHDAGGLLITSTAEPYALSLLQAPGTAGADICVGEGQPLAVPPQFGGPGVGLFACRQKFVRQMPGRLVGETVDEHDRRCFVLTLSTREQHIRRDRAPWPSPSAPRCSDGAASSRRGRPACARRPTSRAASRTSKASSSPTTRRPSTSASSAARPARPPRCSPPSRPRASSPASTSASSTTPGTTTSWSRSPRSTARKTSTAWSTPSPPPELLHRRDAHPPSFRSASPSRRQVVHSLIGVALQER
jgi:glycine dehydrogenase subunit 1